MICLNEVRGRFMWKERLRSLRKQPTLRDTTTDSPAK